MWEEVLKLYENTIAFSVKDLSIFRFGYAQVSWNQSQADAKGQMTYQIRQGGLNNCHL